MARWRFFRSHLLVLLIGSLLLSDGQKGFSKPALSSLNYFFHAWQSQDGLPQNTVTAVVQTRDGYLWVGSYGGLARFDGVSFTVFDDHNAPALRSCRVTSLYEANDGTLWIGHAGGEVTTYRNGLFEPVEVRAGWRPGKISEITQDEKGDIWLFNGEALLARLKDGLVLKPEAGVAAQLGWLARSKQGKIWVARDGRVSLLEGETLKPLQFSEASSNHYVLGIGAGLDGGIWLIVDGHLRKWIDGQLGEDRGATAWASIPVSKLLETREGLIAAGTSDHGLYFAVPDLKNTTLFNRSNGFPSDWIIALCEDREGQLWAGTGAGGLVAIHASNVRTVAPPDRFQGRPILSVTTSRDGALWIGTEGAGIYRHKDGTWTNIWEKGKIGNPYVWSIAEDEQGEIWAGTWSAGLQLWRGDRLIRAPGWEQFAVPTTALLCSRRGGLWAGTGLGLVHYKDGKINRPADDSRWRDVRGLAEEPDGTLWFGMSGAGLARLKDGTVQQFGKGDGLASDFIETLRLEDDGTLWIGTFGGLNRWKAGQFSTISRDHGLANDVICSIQDDGLGFFWISSHGGIMRVSKTELNACADGSLKKVHCLTYGVSDGLPTLECTGGLQPAGCKTADGRLWFPTSKGLVTVDPREVKTNRLAPPIVLEKLLVDDQLHWATGDRSKKIRIQPGRHQFEFEYTGLSFVAPEKVRFRYRLQGLDGKWVDAGAKRSVNLTFLPPGDYVFQVTACNNDGVWNETGASLAFVVLPYFWQTLWFRFLVGSAMVVASGGVVWFDTRRRMRRKLEKLERQRAIENERARIAHDIHDDLGSQLTRITMLSESARGELDNPSQAAEDLNEIYDTARDVTRAMDEIVWAVNPKHDTLDSLVSYLEKFALDFLGTANIRCRLDMPPQFSPWPLTAELRHNLFLAYKEALNNVAKHAAASEVRIVFEVKASEFKLSVEDNGRGFVRAPGSLASGNGLENMARRVNDIGGSCDISSTPGKGTNVVFAVPLKADPF